MLSNHPNVLGGNGPSASSDLIGDVDGPASATDNAIARFDGTTGKLIQNSSVTVSDEGDLTLGTSGPSVKSSLAARAARQGLVFNGTAGATLTGVPAFRTNDFTISFQLKVSAWPAAAATITQGITGSLDLYYTAAGAIVAQSYSGSSLLTVASAVTLSENASFALIRSGSTLTFYKNGTVIGSASGISNDFTTAETNIGGISPFATTGTLSVLIYNRALSATEVVSLYESGVPSGADYNTASNTALNNNTFSNIDFTTFTSASSTGFTATNTSGAFKYAKSAGVFSIATGQRFRVRYTLSGTFTNLRVELAEAGVAGKSTFAALSAGTNELTLVATGATANGVLQIFSNGSADNFTLSNVIIDRPGLLLAPDAAQAGGGLAWYDTSGNAANITLPASGVTWNVPTSGYFTAPTTTNLTLAGGSTGASLVLGQGASGAATLTGGVGGKLAIGTTTNVSAYQLQVYGATSANVIAANGVTPDGTKIGGIFGTALGGTGASTGSYALAGDIAGRFVMSAYGNNFIYEAASIQAEITTGGNIDRNLHVADLDFYTKPTASNVLTRKMRLTGTGNLLIGTTTDGGQKLQVNGTAAFAGDVSVSKASPNLNLVNSSGSTVAQFLAQSSVNRSIIVGQFGDSSAGTTLGVANSSAAYLLTATTGVNYPDKLIIGTTGRPAPIYFGTNGTLALTLDGSTQAATFAGAVSAGGATAGVITPQLTSQAYYQAGLLLTNTKTDNAGVRNWALVTAQDSYGDFQIKQSTTLGGSATAGTAWMKISETGAATFAGAVTAGGTTIVSQAGSSGAPVEAVRLTNTTANGSVYLNFNETNSTATPAYLIRYGSTNASSPNILELNATGTGARFRVLPVMSISDTTPSGGAGSGALQVAGGIYSGAASVFGGRVWAGASYNAGLINGNTFVANGGSGNDSSIGIVSQGAGYYNIINFGDGSLGDRVKIYQGNGTGDFKIAQRNGGGALTDTLTMSAAGAATFAGAVTTTSTGFSATNASGSVEFLGSRSSTSTGVTVTYKTGATINWFHGLRGLVDNNWYLFNNSTSTNTLIFDYGTNAATFAGTVIAPAATTAISSVRLPHGTAPTSPVNGDMWTTTAGLYVRINGVTVGPLS